MKILLSILKILGLSLLAIACFGPAFLLLTGVDPPSSNGVKGSNFYMKGYLYTWWGRFLAASFSLAIGWLGFWAIVGRPRVTRSNISDKKNGTKKHR